MTDQDSLFFMPLISRALESETPKQSLQIAFDEILARSSDPRFSEGMENFRVLLANVSRRGFSSHLLLLEREDGVEEKVSLERGAEAIIEDVPSGAYCLRLWSGRILWKGVFSESETIRSDDSIVRLAASVGVEDLEPSRVVDLLNGEITVAVYPGYETGMARIRWNKK